MSKTILLIFCITILLLLKKKEHFKSKDKIYISLTTIPSRIEKLEPILDSLLDQQIEIEKILLNIPKYSIRFKKEYKIPKFLKKDKFKNKIEIIRCNDYGPGTKLLGCLDYFDNYKNKENTYIIIIDDDRKVNKKLFKHLYDNQLKHKNNIIANKGSRQALNVKIPWGAGGISFPLKFLNKKDILDFFKKHEVYCRYVDDVFWYKYFVQNKKYKIKYFEKIKLIKETNRDNPLYKEKGKLKRYDNNKGKGLNRKCYESK